MNATNQTNDKTTAHELWCRQLTHRLKLAVNPPNIEEKKFFYQVSKDELKRTIENVTRVATQFETTRLRILTDEMILLLQEAQKAHETFASKARNTSWIHWRKRSEFIRMSLEAKIMLDAYQKCVLILVNTKPPF